jgi:uncharacterized membrane-anchored protein
VPALYWIAVVLISVVGTLITDKLHDDLGVSLERLTLIFAVALAAIFAIWYATEKTLSIRTIYSGRREGFYWLAILATFALGTAAGDLGLEKLTTAFGQIPSPDNPTQLVAAHPQAALLVSAGLFAAIISLAAVGHVAFKLNSVLMFWIAYIFTRPFGANIGDVLTLDPEEGGLGLSKLGINALFLAAIVAAVIYLTISKKDARPDPRFVVETKAEHALHVSQPQGEHHVFLVQDHANKGTRLYEVRDRAQRSLRFTGQELDSIALWWSNEATRPGADATTPAEEGPGPPA